MPYPPQVFSLDGHAFGLTVSGVQMVNSVPTDVAPIRWTWPSASTNGDISFTVEDLGQFAFPGGAVIRLTDNVNDDVLFQGLLTNERQQRGTGPWRQTEVTGTGWGLFLDRRHVISWEMDTDYVFIMSEAEAISSLFEQWGGPILGGTAAVFGIGSQAFSPSQGTSVASTTLRPVLDAISDAFEEQILTTPVALPTYYIDNMRAVHWWRDPTDEASVVGTATSIGDQGSLVPEYLTYETGHENVDQLSAAYEGQGTANAFLAWAPNTAIASSWEGGQTTTSYSVDYSAQYWIVGGQASHELAALHSPVVAVTFSTTEDSSYRPHMEVTVQDSLLTGGVAETFYVSDVSGTIDERNVIELTVSLGARARSIVQTVAGQ